MGEEGRGKRKKKNQFWQVALEVLLFSPTKKWPLSLKHSYSS